jgi:predicted Zn finger-like uncharacterized protein
MLISCISCNSKYLVNSADLKPNGRIVECVTCGNQWYQAGTVNEEENILIPPFSSIVSQTEKEETNLSSRNLPSTYVKEQKASILNSILIIIFIIIIIGGFWLIRYFDLNSFVLFKFYVEEFYFNLKLIVDDIAKIIHSIIN